MDSRASITPVTSPVVLFSVPAISLERFRFNSGVIAHHMSEIKNGAPQTIRLISAADVFIRFSYFMNSRSNTGDKIYISFRMAMQ